MEKSKFSPPGLHKWDYFTMLMSVPVLELYKYRGQLLIPLDISRTCSILKELRTPENFI